MKTTRYQPASTRGPRPALAVRRFALTEVIVAATALAMLTACFFATYHHLRRTSDRLILESRAILVLDNVLERLRPAGRPSAEQLGQLVDRELAGSQLSGHLVPVIDRDQARLALQLRDREGKTLAKVVIPCGK